MKHARKNKPIEVRFIHMFHRIRPQAHEGRFFHDQVSLLAPPGVDTWFGPGLPHFFLVNQELMDIHYLLEGYASL